MFVIGRSSELDGLPYSSKSGPSQPSDHSRSLACESKLSMARGYYTRKVPVWIRKKWVNVNGGIKGRCANDCDDADPANSNGPRNPFIRTRYGDSIEK